MFRSLSDSGGFGLAALCCLMAALPEQPCELLTPVGGDVLRCRMHSPSPPHASCLPGAAPAHICNADLKFSLINDLPSTAGGGQQLLLTRSQVSWKFCCCCSQSRFCLSACLCLLSHPLSPVSASLCSGHNQRMEFLGDSIMQLVATEYLFIHFPDHHEGHLTVRPPPPQGWITLVEPQLL